jgi:hypothetical protein
MELSGEGRLTEEAFRQKVREGKAGRPLFGRRKVGDAVKRPPTAPPPPRPR